MSLSVRFRNLFKFNRNEVDLEPQGEREQNKQLEMA